MKTIPTVQIDIETGWRGGQRQVELLCRGLSARGHPVTLFTRPGSQLGERLEGSGVDVIRSKVRFEFDPLAVRNLRRVLAEKKPVVVGMHASHAHTLGALTKTFGGVFARYVVTRRVDFLPGSDPVNRWKYISFPDGYIAISKAISRILEKAGVTREKIYLVPSGVTPPLVSLDARTSLIEQLDVPPGAVLVGDVASLVDHKGHKFLIDAIPDVINAFPHVLFLLAGDGPLRPSLETRAKQLGLTDRNLRFLGFWEDVGLLLGGLDLFVMTSHLEGLCSSIIDAQLAGVPVVGTEAGGIPELVLPERTGWLAKNRSPKDIAKRIIEALSDAQARKRMALAARERALSHFTADSMVEGTLAAYHKILGIVQ